MKVFKRFLLYLILICSKVTLSLVFLTCPTFADCRDPTDAQEVLTCALNNHPVILEAQAKANQSQSLEAVASQRPNPELSAQADFGKSAGAPVVNSDIVIAHTFELGGKRSARIEKAQAEKNIVTTEVLKAREEVALSVVTSLYRLRQLRAEIEALDEALRTFSQIKRQLKTRLKLTPEQRVGLSIFKLAESDYSLRKISLEGEGRSLTQLVSVAIAAPFKVRKEILPKKKENWPSFQEAEDVEKFSGSDFSRLRAEVQSAKADFSLAQSNSWPNLKMGPSFQTQTQAGLSYQAYGMSLSLPLPIYQANGGGKMFANLGIDKADITLRSSGDLLRTERNREIIHYNAALLGLQQASTLREVEKEHRNIEDLFRIGLIQINLVIEAHRQIVDLTRSVNEQELAAIRSLWRIYAIEGRVLEEQI